MVSGDLHRQKAKIVRDLAAEWARLAEEVPSNLPELLKGVEERFAELEALERSAVPAVPTASAESGRADLRAALEEASQAFLRLKQRVESVKRDLGRRLSELRRDPRPLRGQFDRKA